LRIFEDLLAKITPTTVLDAGCGSGVPLVTFLKAGYDAYGFDRSPEMVEETQKRVKNSGFEETRVFHGDLDTFERPIAKPFDVACGLGSVYYTPNTVATLRHIATHVKNDGVRRMSTARTICFATFFQLPILLGSYVTTYSHSLLIATQR
jgi:SAM-dependent methyltransferase